MRVFVRLWVCLSARERYPANHMPDELRRIFCCLWPWLGPHLVVL